MPRLSPDRRIPHGTYWKTKLDAATTPMAKFGESSDYFRAAIKSCRDQGVAEATLLRETERLIKLAKELKKVPDPGKETPGGRHRQ